jgi:hypothetical protein|tara:strand:+ start:140 stop:439 length:300 start_codon:yes stop_codon:yes gene_type:complete
MTNEVTKEDLTVLSERLRPIVNKERDYVVKWMYCDCNDRIWEELRHSLHRGGLNERLREVFGKELNYEDLETIWDTIIEHPFIMEFITLLNKWNKELKW